MRPVLVACLVLLAAAAGAGGGYWFARPAPAPDEPPGNAHTSHDHTPAPTADRKPLYYRNPMGLPDTSAVPKQDSMGMDYIPVYADEAEDGSGVVRISPARVQMLGVRTEAAARRTLVRPVRAVGTVEFSERQQAIVSMRFEGWIEKLNVDTTGAAVRQGEPLMQVYSPVLVQTQQEYADALRLGSDRLAAGALQRLGTLDVPPSMIRRLQQGGEVSRTIAWPSPVAGIVLEKPAVAGMRFMPGEPLFRIAGISPVWVIAEVFEQDLAVVSIGQPAAVTVKTYPGRSFAGRVAYIYPAIAMETRTGRVRIELANPRGELKAGMYASVELATPAGAADALTVPDSAVIDNGSRQVVLIERGEGRFEPRPVTVGAKAGGYSEILTGLDANDRVVVSANFLIDAESNLKAALGAFTAGEHQH